MSDDYEIPEGIRILAEQMKGLYDQAYARYKPIAHEYLRQTVSEDELSRLFDYMLDFIHDDRVLELFKALGRKYVGVYPDTIDFYVREAIREREEDQDSDARGED